MTQEISPYGLRMSPELRAKVTYEAKLNRRSINGEINARLERSFINYRPAPELAAASAAMDSAPSGYQALTDSERVMLKLFKRWSPDKQLSFLVLFE